MERRRAERSELLMMVDIEFGLTTLRGAIVDASPTGVRLFVLPAAEIPEVVTLRLPDGSAYAACCRWHRDDEAGFELLPLGARKFLKTWGGISEPVAGAAYGDEAAA